MAYTVLSVFEDSAASSWFNTANCIRLRQAASFVQVGRPFPQRSIPIRERPAFAPEGSPTIPKVFSSSDRRLDIFIDRRPTVVSSDPRVIGKDADAQRRRRPSIKTHFECHFSPNQVPF